MENGLDLPNSSTPHQRNASNFVVPIAYYSANWTLPVIDSYSDNYTDITFDITTINTTNLKLLMIGITETNITCVPSRAIYTSYLYSRKLIHQQCTEPEVFSRVVDVAGNYHVCTESNRNYSSVRYRYPQPQRF